jgi:hypothetical protein
MIMQLSENSATSPSSLRKSRARSTRRRLMMLKVCQVACCGAGSCSHSFGCSGCLPHSSHRHDDAASFNVLRARAGWLETGEEELVNECESAFLVQKPFYLCSSAPSTPAVARRSSPGHEPLPAFYVVPIKCQPHPPKVLLPAGRVIPTIVNLIASIHSRRPAVPHSKSLTGT